MTPGVLAGYFFVPVFGALMCAAPAVTRPTLQFGVRIPPAHTGAAVIRRERRAYYWRSAAVAVCCAALAIILWGSGPRWLPRVILLLEVAADVSCLWLARTSWRTQPRPFPVRWLMLAISVIAATTVIGVIRYPYLPAHLATGLATLGGRRVPRSPVSAFAMVIAQLYVTGMWTGLMVLIYRSRPDIDAADPTSSLRRYRGAPGQLYPGRAHDARARRPHVPAGRPAAMAALPPARHQRCPPPLACCGWRAHPDRRRNAGRPGPRPPSRHVTSAGVMPVRLLPVCCRVAGGSAAGWRRRSRPSRTAWG